jgi:hypothetical protein
MFREISVVPSPALGERWRFRFQNEEPGTAALVAKYMPEKTRIAGVGGGAGGSVWSVGMTCVRRLDAARNAAATLRRRWREDGPA